VHAEVYLPILVLIAEAVLLLECGQTDKQTDKQTRPNALPNAGSYTAGVSI